MNRRSFLGLLALLADACNAPHQPNQAEPLPTPETNPMAPAAFIQGNTTVGGSGTSSQNCAFPGANTNGSLLFCYARFSLSGGAGPPTFAISDSNGNSGWTLVGTSPFSFVASNWVQAFYCLNAKPGANTVTVSVSGGGAPVGFIRIALGEYGPGITALDQTGTYFGTGSSVTSYRANQITVTQSNVLVIGCATGLSASASVTPVGCSVDECTLPSCDATIGSLAASGGIYAPTFEYSAPSSGCAVAFSFTTSSSSSSPAGVWQKKGVVLSGTQAEFNNGTGPMGVYAPNVIYEGNPQIIAGVPGNIFKMWFGSAGGIGYAESTDGVNWQRFGGNPVLTSFPVPDVTKIGNTYYACGPSTNGLQLNIFSSSNGTTWSAYQSNILALDGGFIAFTHGLLYAEGATWYLIYDEYNSGVTTYQICVATSTNLGATWTKNPSNPIIAMDNASGPHLFKIGGTYYIWAESWHLTGSSPITGFSDMMRYHSSNILSGWVRDTQTMARTESDEGLNGQGSYGQLTDLSFVDLGTQVYMWYVASSNQFNGGRPPMIKMATASGSLAGLVSGFEGLATDTITNPGSAAGNFVQATSSFPTGNSVVLAYGSNNTLNNLLVAVMRINDSVSVADMGANITVSDTQTNTWVYAGTFATGTTALGERYAMFYVQQSKAGANTVTASVTPGTGTINWDFIIAEYSGVGAAPVPQGFSTETSVSASGLLGNLHTRRTNALLLAFYANYTANTLTFTPGTGWTNRANANGNTVLLDGLAGTLGTYQNTCGFSASIGWAGAIAAFQTIVSSISGNVGRPGVTVNYSGTASGSVVSDASGNYTIPNLANGSYTVTPAPATGLTFTPASQNVTVSNGNILALNFTPSGGGGDLGPSYDFKFKI